MSRSLVTTLAAALTFNAIAAHAANSKSAGPGQHWFTAIDTNEDGRITLNEYLAAETTRFAALDVQHRGAIDAVDIGAAPTVAHRIKHRAEGLVRWLDANGDGRIDTTEAIGATDRRFDTLDTNHDGHLTAAELGANGGRRSITTAELRLDKLDTNHDDVVDRAEFRANAQRRFARIDATGDGTADAAEIAESPAARERVAHRADRLVQRLDVNHDGLVSQAEFLAGARERFAKLDRNGDGALTAADRPVRPRSRHPA